ncbi:hypothetical protein FACS1894109_17150 [Spirochaetia bacterium]|nr:hypothetical protein FACS1894109_17150 [Spirochaetia bacterium]
MVQIKVRGARFFLILPLLFSVAALIMGLGRQDTDSPEAEKPRTVQVSGRVRLIGSGSGQELVITGTGREWRIDKKDQDKLWNLQQQTVTVEGLETSQEMTFANGTLAGIWYYLRVIRIISVSQAEN